MTTRKTKAVSTQSTYSFDIFVNGKLTHIEKPVQPLTMDMLDTLVKAENAVSDSIVGALLAGTPLPYTKGAEYVKAVNEARQKGAPIVTKTEVKSGYDYIQLANKVREITTEPLQAKWNEYTQFKIAEREAVNKENLIRKANGESPFPAVRVTKPTVKGLIDLVSIKAEVNHNEAMVKSLKTAYNHALELKGKQAMQDAEKIAAMIISNGGDLPKQKTE